MPGTIILAGGKGNRIGGRKPFMELEGRSLVHYVLKVTRGVSDETVVVTSRDMVKRFEALLPEDVKVVSDIVPGRGPLVGVYSGLNHIRSEYAMVLPCDAPFINEHVLKHLIGEAEGVDAVVPLWPNGYIEPLHSVYRVSAAFKASKAAVREMSFKISNMIERLERTLYVPVERLKRFDLDLLTFFNVNSTEDLKDAEAILKRRRKN